MTVNSPWIERVDFEAINRAQDRRHAATLKELRTLLFEMQKRTLGWAEENLIRRKARTSIKTFQLPLQAKYKAILRGRMESAARAGHLDVRKETGVKAQPFRGPDQQRARERADALADDHLGRLRQDLVKAWNQAMTGPLDATQIRYVTRKVYADFAGWVQPEV